MEPVQSVCGWAFSSEGRPWVAHRVCPMPSGPSSGRSRSAASRLRRRPALRRTWSTPSATTATPAESYPRYSSRFSPSRMIPVAHPNRCIRRSRTSCRHLTRSVRLARNAANRATRVPARTASSPLTSNRQNAAAPTSRSRGVAVTQPSRRCGVSPGSRPNPGDLPWLAFRLRAPPMGPALLDDLWPTLHGQRSRGYILRDHDPAPTYASSPIVSGATRLEFVPTKARAPIRL